MFSKVQQQRSSYLFVPCPKNVKVDLEFSARSFHTVNVLNYSVMELSAASLATEAIPPDQKLSEG